VEIRDARPDEFGEVGDVRVAAYLAHGFLSPQSAYAPILRELGADGVGQVLVAVDGDPGAGRILGTVMLQGWHQTDDILTGPGEAEIRALAVVPEAQDTGIGRRLLAAVIGRAEAVGVRRLLLLTRPDMKAAQHLYEQAGFSRLPDRDWSPSPGLTLLAYALDLRKEPLG
jgi:ribosomal protein S18 acetylase RimI-like enzyme